MTVGATTTIDLNLVSTNTGKSLGLIRSLGSGQGSCSVPDHAQLIPVVDKVGFSYEGVG